MATIARLNATYGASFLLLMSLGYFTQGLRCFPWMAMSYWYKDTLKVDPGQMQFLMSTAALPMVAKPIYGIISDSVYIKGAHRLPYLIIAGALQLFAWTAIAVHSGVSSTASVLTLFLTITNLGGAISEVVNDAMIAEAGKNKAGAQQGELQSFAWLALASGGVVGNLTAGYAVKILSPRAMLTIFISLVAAQLVLALTVSERSFALGPIKKDTDDSPESKHVEKGAAVAMRDQISKLKASLQKPEIFKPLLWFLSSYAVIPGLGSALFYYQTQYLRLGASVLGLARVVGQVGLLFGSMLYNKSLKNVPIRRMFATVQVLLSLCMLTDIVLVKRINLDLGIPDKWFVLGASAFVEAIGQFKILPFMVLLAKLCPPGSEASLFAFFMSAQCLAGLTNGYLGVALASYLQISAHDFSGLPLGICIQAFFALIPVLWIGLIPPEPKVAGASLPDPVEAKKEL
jgi:folate/biopterin transporter